ncbi:hypothetical protein Vadar_002885 [Vaccinium darrowii]|uniref:Uncharacterized protein n=1 Tax=Vaccinium darrowii TaxID=229202 RepID=A0ACB7ZI37_9ERIC|nr:hypothetical protein Vadar_002885 [Vaccinium darrowii]
MYLCSTNHQIIGKNHSPKKKKAWLNAPFLLKVKVIRDYEAFRLNLEHCKTYNASAFRSFSIAVSVLLSDIYHQVQGADSKIYDATEWYICQGMRSPVNTHKPSFHVNTSLPAKHNNGKGASSGQRGGSMPSSSPNLEENMTEEEFFEWLQNAVQAGVFDNFAGSTSREKSSFFHGSRDRVGVGDGRRRWREAGDLGGWSRASWSVTEFIRLCCSFSSNAS